MVLSGFMDLLSVRRCIGCSNETKDSTLCEQCESLIPKTLWSPSFDVDGVNELYCMGDYNLLPGQLVRFAKYGKREDAAQLLGRHFAVATRSQRFSFDAIIPVPQSWTSSLWRGFSLTTILANYVAKTLHAPLVHALSRQPGPRLAGTAPHRRQLIAMSQFATRTTQVRERILLIDDVVTTGATANICASLLREQGAKEVVFIAACSPKI